MNENNNCIYSSTVYKLCSESMYLSTGIKSLLGNGLKFCIQPCKILKEQKKESRARFKRDVCIKYFFSKNTLELKNNSYDPHLYLKSNWEVIEAEPDLEDMMENMFDKIDEEGEKQKIMLQNEQICHVQNRAR